KTADDLSRFTETRANAMRLTAPLPVLVEEPDAELNRLFKRVVGEGEKRKKRTGMVARLSAAFERAGVSHLVRRKVTLALPRFQRLEHLDDLIQEIRTTAKPIDATLLNS